MEDRYSGDDVKWLIDGELYPEIKSVAISVLHGRPTVSLVLPVKKKGLCALPLKMNQLIAIAANEQGEACVLCRFSEVALDTYSTSVETGVGELIEVYVYGAQTFIGGYELGVWSNDADQFSVTEPKMFAQDLARLLERYKAKI